MEVKEYGTSKAIYKNGKLWKFVKDKSKPGNSLPALLPFHAHGRLHIDDSLYAAFRGGGVLNYDEIKARDGEILDCF